MNNYVMEFILDGQAETKLFPDIQSARLWAAIFADDNTTFYIYDNNGQLVDSDTIEL